MKITIGCDPELFVKENGRLVSAHGMIQGDKKNPLKVANGAVQVDGMALEFNTDPATSYKEFNNNINSVLNILKEMVGDREFAFQPVAEFGKEYIDQQPLEAKILGCEPDYNAYTGEANPAPDADAGFRTASGHIHVGWRTNSVNWDSPAHFEDCRVLAMYMDVLVGWPLAYAEGPNKRAELYGKPGAFRPKPYGMEYRTTSNFWVKRSVTREFVFGATKRAFRCAESGYDSFRGLDHISLNNKILNASYPDYYHGRYGWDRGSDHFDNLARRACGVRQ